MHVVVYCQVWPPWGHPVGLHHLHACGYGNPPMQDRIHCATLHTVIPVQHSQTHRRSRVLLDPGAGCRAATVAGCDAAGDSCGVGAGVLLMPFLNPCYLPLKRMQEQVLLRDGVLGQEGAMGDRSAPVLEDEGGREGGQLLPITASSPAWRKVGAM